MAEIKKLCTFDNCFGSVEKFLIKNEEMSNALVEILNLAHSLLGMNENEITVERFITPKTKGLYIYGHTKYYRASEQYKQFETACNALIPESLTNCFIIDFVSTRKAK